MKYVQNLIIAITIAFSFFSMQAHEVNIKYEGPHDHEVVVKIYNTDKWKWVIGQCQDTEIKLNKENGFTYKSNWGDCETKAIACTIRRADYFAKIQAIEKLKADWNARPNSLGKEHSKWSMYDKPLNNLINQAIAIEQKNTYTISFSEIQQKQHAKIDLVLHEDGTITQQI